jgi:hypothetical protein
MRGSKSYRVAKRKEKKNKNSSHPISQHSDRSSLHAWEEKRFSEINNIIFLKLGEKNQAKK